MKRKFILAAMAAVVATPVAIPAPAMARHHYDRDYHGRDGRYHYRCKRSSGTTGLIAGGAGGAVLGSVLGGGTLGTILGAVGGGLLGKNLDQNHDRAQNYRNGC